MNKVSKEVWNEIHRDGKINNVWNLMIISVGARHKKVVHASDVVPVFYNRNGKKVRWESVATNIVFGKESLE